MLFRSVLWICYGKDCVLVRVQERHNDQSHQVDKSKYLKTEQIAALCKQVKSNPVQCAAEVRHSVNNRSPQKFISPELKRHVQRKVSTLRKEVNRVQLDGIELNSKYDSLLNFAQQKVLQDLLQRYNFLSGLRDIANYVMPADTTPTASITISHCSSPLSSRTA